MVPARFIASSSFALIVALVPMVASADHGDEEVANALAQLELAQDAEAEMRQEAEISASSDRVSALVESQEFRTVMLANTANGRAIEALTASLANAARMHGEQSAHNELVIAHGRAQVLLTKMHNDLANAYAMGRPDEIRNAEAQARLMQSLADGISGTLAETAMSSSRINAEMRADAVHTPGLSEAANSRAMAADQLLEADLALNAGELAAFNTLSIGYLDAGEGVAEALESLENAYAQDAASE